MSLIPEMIEKARVALKELEPYTQEQIDELVKAVCLEFKAHAEELSREVVEETGLGNYEDKLNKNLGTPDGMWYAMKGKKSVGIIDIDEEEGIAYVAKPKGIISVVAPTTNPNITALCNCTFALKGRNVCIIAAHPRAKKTTAHTVAIMNAVMERMGAPKNVFQCIEEPSIEKTQELMAASDVVVATGGAGMVRSAYSCGHPAFGVGPGNVQSVIDYGYDVKEAAAMIVMGRKFDNGLICACNQSVIVPREMEKDMVEALKAEHTYYIEDAETVEHMRSVLFKNGVINKDVVGQSAVKIAGIAGIEVPEDTLVIAIKVDKIGAEEVLCGEKMCPVLVVIAYDGDYTNGVAIAKANLLYQGAGHSAVIYTNDQAHAEYAGIELPVSRMLVNQPGVFAANPALANGLSPTTTLGCGSWGNNSISENLAYHHLINISRISYMKAPEKMPTQESIWGE